MTVATVRVLTGDTNQNQVLSDPDLQEILDAVSGNVFAASANALRAVAVNQVLLYKKVQVEGFLVDGPAMADALLKAAKQFDDLVGEDTIEGVGVFTDVGAF